MIWFFIAVTVAAIGAMIIRSVDEGRALPGAIVYTLLFVAIFFVASSLFFFIAYFFGSIERSITPPSSTPTSPFGDSELPPQLIPPRPSDERL